MAEPMKCDRCDAKEEAVRERWGDAVAESFRRVTIPDSAIPERLLCIFCWADLLLWLRRPPN